MLRVERQGGTARGDRGRQGRRSAEENRQSHHGSGGSSRPRSTRRPAILPYRRPVVPPPRCDLWISCGRRDQITRRRRRRCVHGREKRRAPHGCVAYPRPVAEILVLGGGVCGLGTALMLAHDGHEVTVLERDPQPPPASA